jgi:hypothetical protein
MKEFLELTLIEIQQPKSYGLFHIITSVVLLSLAIFFAWKLRNTNEKQHKIVLASVGIGLLLCELYKILVHVIVDPYGWGFYPNLPYQLCSVPMYLCIICLLPLKGKVKSYLYEFMFAVNMFGGLISFFEPSGLNRPHLSLTMHAYLWHASLVFIGLYLYFSKRACTNKKSFYKVVVVYILASLLAQAFNLIYADTKIVNAFYISPFVQSPLVVFTEIYAKYGWLVNMILYMSAIMIASALVYYIGYYCRVLSNKKNKEKSPN